jgi:hypothetical protein
MDFPELSNPASDRRVVEAFRLAADAFEDRARKAFSGCCLSIGGIFMKSCGLLRESADVIEDRPGRGYSNEAREVFRRTQDQLWNVGWFMQCHRDRFEQYRAAINSRALPLVYDDAERLAPERRAP